MQKITLDLVPGKKMPSLNASQFDDGRAYHIDLTENRVPYVLDGTETISVIIRKCDNTLVSMDIANTFANKSYLEFEVVEQMTACSGFNYGEIILEKNGDRLGSLNFYLQVEAAPDENGITSQSEINNLARQVHDIVVEELEDHGAEETGYDNTESGLEATNVQDAVDEVNTKIENIPSVDAYTKQESDSFLADEYDATQTYAAGDYRIHEGGLYVCNTPITTPEAWNASHWTLTDVGTALGNKADADEVNNKFKSIDGIQTIPFEMGNIDITLHGWSYSAATKRIRTPENYTIALKEGDVINAESGVRYYLGWQLSNDTYKRKGWLTGKTVIEESGDYVILASLDPEVTLESVDEVASKITVYAYTGTLAGEVNDCVYYEANINVKVGENILGQATLSTGWSESDGTYTHTSGNTNALVFDTTAVEGEIYLFEFDGVTPEETVSVGLGDTVYKMYVYTDNPHKIVPLKAYGDCKLYIEPLNNFSGSMSNLTLRKIQSSGTDVLLTVNAVYSKNHDNNYGFYNALIGKSTAQNAVGSTRTVAIGANALRDLQAGHRNIAIGTFAMSQMLGGEANVAIGADAMLAVQKSYGCVAIGKSSLYNGTDISYNVAIGLFAGQGSSGYSPTMCTFIGAFAGAQNRANYNTFIGSNSGYNVVSGNQNTFVGDNIKGQATGNRNTCIGRSSGYPSGANDCIAIGKGATCTKSGQMMLGSTDITEVVVCGNKKINFNQDGSVTWETLT